MSKLTGLYKIARAEITIAFIVPVVLLGVACAVSTGVSIDWNNLIIGTGVIFFLIMMSNGLNNLVDEKIDIAAREAGSEKSRKYHLLNIWGGMSRNTLLSVVVLSGFAFGLALSVLAMRTGYLTVVFALFGLFMALEYNLPPLKLAYRPFPELTMLFPATVVAVMGIQYILISQVTSLAIHAGVVFGLFSGSWFVWQSILDYEVDKAAGKNTTAVFAGPLNAAVISICYPITGVGVMIAGSQYGLEMYAAAWIGCGCVLALSGVMTYYKLNAFKIWQWHMLITCAFGVLAAYTIFAGVIV